MRCLATPAEAATFRADSSYMSPEQAEGKAVGARSDIFSFGSVLYEMLTGRQAFQGDSTISTLSAIIEKDPPPLSIDIPPLLGRIITRSLHKDPARRFQAMSDLKVELEELKNEAESGRLQVVPAVVKRASPFRLAVVAFAVIALVAAGWYWLTRQRSAAPEAVLTPVPLTSYPGYESPPRVFLLTARKWPLTGVRRESKETTTYISSRSAWNHPPR